MTKLRETAQCLPPKFAVRKLCQDVGDVTGASSASQLPRSRQQAADCRRKLTYGTNSAVMPKSADPLFPLMLMCKESEGTKGQHENFVRMVANSPEPMAVLAFDWILDDLERFCTCEAKHTVLCVDPTFDLGSFHVTVMSYRHLMLGSRRGSERGKHPVMLGPLFIHQRKQFSSYHFFISQLVGLRPALQNIKAVGTDGEQALVSALATQFKSAIPLRCFLHVRGNLETKLSELKLPKAIIQEFIWDVFGNPALLQLGLVDAEDSSDLDSQFLQLEAFTLQEPVFHSWFKAYTLEVVRNGMLKEKRILAGPGCPPEPFYTNDVESKNRVLKHQRNYRKQELPQFVEQMRELIMEQRSEVEKAVAGLGEYNLTSAYQNLGVETKRWFLKTEAQRKRAKFMTAKLVESVESQEAVSTVPCSAQDGGSCSRERSLPFKDNPLRSTSLPQYTQDSMWKKVQGYLDDPTSYTSAPGVTNKSCMLVKSASGTKPHFVQRSGKSKYKCDGDCLMFKSTNGICSHTLLVAALNDEVCLFICNYSKSKAPVNYVQLAQHGLPLGGRKPSSKRKGASKKTTAGIRQLIQNANESEMTKRSDITASKKNLTTDLTPSSSTMTSSTSVSIPDPLPNSRQCVNTSSSVMWPVSDSSPLLPSNASGPTTHTNAPQPVALPQFSWNPTLHSGMDQPLRAKSFGSTSALPSRPVDIPLSQPHLLPIPHQVHPVACTSSSVNTPPTITVASELVGCTSTPQPIGPPPLIQCAAPLASTAQVNIQAVPYLTPPQFYSPSQP